MTKDVRFTFTIDLSVPDVEANSLGTGDAPEVEDKWCAEALRQLTAGENSTMDSEIEVLAERL